MAKNRPVFVFDCETFPIRPGCAIPPLVVLGFCTGGDVELLHVRDPECYEVIKSALLGEELLVGFNVAYDLSVVAAQWPDLLPLVFEAYESGRVRCLMISDKLRAIAEGRYGQEMRGLADLTYEFFGLRLDKGEDTWRSRYGELIDIAVQDWPEEAVSYLEKDVAYTYKCWRRHEAIFESPDEARQACHGFWTHLMGSWGLHTDRQMVDRAVAWLKGEQAREVVALHEAGLVRKDGSKDTKLAKARMEKVMAELGLEPKRTDKGGIKLDKDACKDSGDDLLKAYSSYAQHSTKLTRVEQLAYPPIQPQFISLVDNGRISCRKGEGLTRGAQVHNLGRKGPLRLCFIPRPGCVFAITDLEGAEMRSMSQVNIWIQGYSKMAEMLNSGIDPLKLLAEEIVGHKIDWSDPKNKEHRQSAKACIYGYPGALGDAAMVPYAWNNYGVRTNIEETRRWRQVWLALFPEFKYYFEYVRSLNGTVVQFKSHRVRSGLHFPEACNTLFSGLMADAAKAAAWAVTRECYLPGTILYGSRLVNFPHDEYNLEVPEPIGHECAMRLGEIVLEVVRKYMPDVPPKTNPCLARRMFKGAEAMFDSTGRLVPVDADTWED